MSEGPQKKKGSRWFLVLDIIVIIAFVVLLVVAAETYSSTNDYTLSVYQAEDNYANIPTWDIFYNFTTNAVFSTLNPITAHVIVNFDANITHIDPNIINDAPKTVFIYFPAAFPMHPKYVGGEELGSSLVLHEEKNGTYANSTTLTYYEEGPQCAFLTTSPQPFVNACNFSAHPALFTISSVDALYQYQTNKATLSLTLVVLAFTIILIRPFAADLVENFWLIRNKRQRFK